MKTKTLRRWVPALALLVTVATVGTAGAADERDRQARVALALAGGKPATTIAPAPRAKVPTYPDAYRRAAEDARPLVVFVGLDLWPVRGAVVAKTDTFAGTEGPAVVVGYPVADRLFVHATIRGDGVTVKEVQASADAAAKKIDAPPAKAMPAPSPLDWMLQAEPAGADQFVGLRRRAAPVPCPSGDGCAAGAKAEAPAVAAYREVWHTDGRRSWRELVPATPGYMTPGYILGGCANGRCPAPR